MREIFLVTFKGASYGIWKDDILSVRGLDALHWIPLTPDCIAGIMIDNGQSVTLADLPVCIGHDATRKTEPGCILLKKGEHKTLGFVVNGELRTLSIPPERVFPLPGYLCSPVFDTCAIYDGVPIPLINLTELHGRVLNPDTAVDEASKIPAAMARDISATGRFRFFTSGGERYAASGEWLEQTAATPGAITPLPNTPRYLRGVGFLKDHLLCVIDLARRLKVQATSPGSVMLVVKAGGDEFGFLVDSDEGDCPADEVAIKPVPAILQAPWLKHVLVRGAQITPLIDLAATLTPGSLADKLPVWQRYSLASVFPDIFFKQAVDVVEFTLLGERYTLPKVEVEEVISFLPCRAIPDAPPILVGITEYNGEILPVVDLAMMFGRRSLATHAWRMMLVSNGDFRALVLAKTVSSEKHLPPETHRPMPIHLPHHLIYGCYPDGIAARVILNIAAIVMHFDRSMIQGFMPALSAKMRMSPTAEVYAFPDDRVAQAADVSDAHTPAEAVAEQIAQLPEIKQSHQAELAVHAQPTSITLPATESPAAEPLAAEPPAAEPFDGEPSSVELPEVAPTAAAIAPPSCAHIDSGYLPTPDEQPEPAGSEQGQIAEPVLAATSTGSNARYIKEPEPSFTRASIVGGHRANTVQRNIGYAAIAVILAAALVFFAMPADKGDVTASNNKNGNVIVNKAAQRTPNPAPTIAAPSRTGPIAGQSQIVPPKPATKRDAPLVLEIPADMPINEDMYVVKQGDTLWDISQRLTGNPYNFPHIAGSNNIAKPDLIFPGQRIRLSRKE